MGLLLLNSIMKSLALLLLLFGGYIGGGTVVAEETVDLIKKRFSKLTFITEAYPPYNFVEEGLLRGIAVDLLIAAIQLQSITLKRKNIKIYPWARGYQKLLKGPNIILFSTTRTAARESLFKWAGPISPTRIVLIAAKTRKIKITSKLDTHNYIIGGIRDDVGEQLVLATGYPRNKFISQANANSIVNMLAKQRIDLWAYEEYVGNWFIKQNKLGVEDFETVFLLKEAHLYFAFSKDVDNNLVNLLQQGIDKVKKISGTVGETLYQDILARYM
ncbi:substrate-binding periplasmic protein [Spartinivicinus poritis]|uniref:Transporter substrate-binding domain-containing protein n=1 Tax=Spartinivicinus poritis TaxID=2994640 RepID=A0ABT5UAL5_9GAMM|nr:transporter substrate-binding domain-containing protein [Spartinivicinus sp. A2-2]MDE1463418.1 transporter substrate-binding domain-containing protein [Spartinivicinus sp. A2-2]